MRLLAVVVALSLGLSGCSSSAELQEQLTESRAREEKLSHQLSEASEQLLALSAELPPTVESVDFLSAHGEPLATVGGWIELADRTRIRVKLSGRTTMVDFIYTPTGTGTYVLQRVISSVAVEPGQQEASFEWDVPSTTHGHLWIMAFNGRVARRTEPVNVTTSK